MTTNAENSRVYRILFKDALWQEIRKSKAGQEAACTVRAEVFGRSEYRTLVRKCDALEGAGRKTDRKSLCETNDCRAMKVV